jgi:hypothetical protein
MAKLPRKAYPCKPAVASVKNAKRYTSLRKPEIRKSTTDSDLLGLRGFQLFAETTTNARKTP